MQLFIVDAFTETSFQGNPAGVMLLDKNETFPSEWYMQSLAAELKHSETVYVKQKDSALFCLRYFTPMGEVNLCGHATISAFSVLKKRGDIGTGKYLAETLAGTLDILVEEERVWMDTAQPRQQKVFHQNECEELYSAFGLDLLAKPDWIMPGIVNTGLSDILLPVKNKELLNAAKMDASQVCLLSREQDVIGIHLFCLSETEGVTAFCRNFAPLYGIEEESATGTSNSALTYYLKKHGRIKDGVLNLFVQGEVMGRESKIYTVIRDRQIQVGGKAQILLACELCQSGLCCRRGLE